MGITSKRIKDGRIVRNSVRADGRVVRRSKSAKKHLELVGTALTTRIDHLVKIGATQACNCDNLKSQMDGWGIAGCERHRSYIVKTMVANAEVLSVPFREAAFRVAHNMSPSQAVTATKDAVAAWWTGTSFKESAALAGANWLLDRAIEDVRNGVTEKKPKPKPQEKPTASGNRPARNRERRGGRGAFTQGPGPVRFVSSAQFQKDILSLIAQIPPDITAIAGVARSGLSAATMLSMYLHLPMITIRQTMNDIVDTGNGWRLGGSRHIDPKKGKILVVDDTVMTGNSLKAIEPLIKSKVGKAVYAAIYVNPKALKKPDIWAVDLPWPHILEWNVFNSILSPASAMDFDGILCHDCEPWMDDDGPNYLTFIRHAKPLYVPRRCPVPLIVTARVEKYRHETEAWLRRHGIQWHRLIMHPATSTREREKHDIAEYKAKHYSAWAKTSSWCPGPVLFFESEDRQAAKISLRTGLTTVCPATARVYCPQNSAMSRFGT